MLSSSAFLLKNIVKLAVSIAIDFSFQINRSIEKNWSWRVWGSCARRTCLLETRSESSLAIELQLISFEQLSPCTHTSYSRKSTPCIHKQCSKLHKTSQVHEDPLTMEGSAKYMAQRCPWQIAAVTSRFGRCIVPKCFDIRASDRGRFRSVHGINNDC